MAKFATTPTRMRVRKETVPPPPEKQRTDADSFFDAIAGYAAARQTKGVIDVLVSIVTHRKDGQVDFRKFKREAPAVLRKLMLAGRLPHLRAVDIAAVLGAFEITDAGLVVDPDTLEKVFLDRGRCA